MRLFVEYTPGARKLPSFYEQAIYSVFKTKKRFDWCRVDNTGLRAVSG
jgi:hypothetical protein